MRLHKSGGMRLKARYPFTQSRSRRYEAVAASRLETAEVVEEMTSADITTPKKTTTVEYHDSNAVSG
eukprot:3880307-Prymnesium_polylepis.1